MNGASDKLLEFLFDSVLANFFFDATRLTCCTR